MMGEEVNRKADSAAAMNHIARAIEEAMGEPVNSQEGAPPRGPWLPLSVRYAAAEAAAKVVIEWRATGAPDEGGGASVRVADPRPSVDGSTPPALPPSSGAHSGGDSYYVRPKVPVDPAKELDRINALTTEFEDTGWLSTLVWNTRNSYLAWPHGTLLASQVRMIVEGFLAELQRVDPSTDPPSHSSHPETDGE